MVESPLVVAPNLKTSKPPLGVIAAIAAGFEVVNARLELILWPLALDVFLWLGPRLSLQPLFQNALAVMQDAVQGNLSATQNYEMMRPVFADFAAHFNLFSALSTAPLGLPSLLAGRGALVTPLGAPASWPVSDGLWALLWWGVFGLTGLWLGAAYLGGIAQQVRDGRANALALWRAVWGDWARLTALGVIGLGLAALVGVPLLLVAGLVQLISPTLGAVVSVVLWAGALWVLCYTGFTLQGVLLRRRGLLGALWDSLRVVHFSLSPTLSLYLLIFLLTLGLGGIWNLPPDDSWLLLIGLAGHAFVSTALVAATFAFYHDRYRWWTELQQALQAQARQRMKPNA